MPAALDKLSLEFLQEARSAPRLFQDLAKVEQYIAETYKSRAFIELIQNADDAQASKFGIYDFGGGFAAGNDGTPFTLEDVEALCRSGSSLKRRGGSTIGYRGIGFKSVVNLAKTVYVFSNDYSFFFNKDTTKSLLPGASGVPLIRIPHQVEGIEHARAVAEASRLMRDFGYRTVFVFQETNERLSSEEFLAFDRSCLLFLNHLKHVDLSFGSSRRSISVQVASESGAGGAVRIVEADALDEWEIVRSRRDRKDMVALRKNGDTIVPAPQHESVFHSFTPTTEFAGAYLKINGDYSTDPSRKTIDVDESSQRSFADVVSIVADTIISLLNRTITRKGFFTPFVGVSSAPQAQAKLRLVPALTLVVQSRTIFDSRGEAVPFSSLRLKPEWLGYEDYEKLCHGDITAVGKDLILSYPEIMVFLEQMGVRAFLIDEILAKMNGCDISPFGRAQVTSKCIKQYRFDMDEERIQRLRTVKLFQAASGPAAADEIKSASAVSRDFTQHILENAEAADVRFFYKKLGLMLDDSAIEQPTARPSPDASPLVVAEHSQDIFKTTPAIKLWRSAEKNAEVFLAALNGVMTVSDVSTANLGYDLEVVLQGGQKAYVEVKSVASFSEPFRLTNNEYSSAHNYGDDYFVALVINGEPFALRLIRNPIESLRFQKQCERWSWCCEEYGAKLSEPSDLVSRI